MRGIWRKAEETDEPEIKVLAQSLPHVITSALAKSTVKKYEVGWSQWQKWAQSKPNVEEMPADPWYIAIFLNHILRTNGTKGALNTVVYGIRWAHHTAGYDSPLEHPFVAMALKGCQRLCAKPIKKKDPLTVDFVKELIDHYGPAKGNDLRIARFLVLTTIGFAGFFRIEEMLNTQLKNVEVTSTHMEIHLPKCKNDQQRKGNEVLIARTHSKYCPVALLEDFWRKAAIDPISDKDAYLIPKLNVTKRGHVANKSQGISDTTAREQFAEFTQPLTNNSLSFTPHSLRSGGASQAEANGVESRLISKHGRWRTERARNGYIEDTIQNRLSVSRALGL